MAHLIITEESARELLIIDEEGNELIHTVTAAQLAGHIVSSHPTFNEAWEAAEAGSYILDEDLDSTLVGAPYTYSVFDANPAESGCSAWSGHDAEPFIAKTREDAIQHVRDVLETAADGLNPHDGYAEGDTLYATIWDSAGIIIAEPKYTLTAADLRTAAR